jgi:hypothetical protein
LKITKPNLEDDMNDRLVADRMEDEPARGRACWFYITNKKDVIGGRLHRFTDSHLEYDSGPGHYPVAVVESTMGLTCGAVFVVNAENVCFGSEPNFA